MWKPKHRLHSWMRRNDPNASPPIDLIAAAFPEGDAEQWEYYHRKPHRIYERLYGQPYYRGRRYYL